MSYLLRMTSTTPLIISTNKLRKGSSFALATGVPFIIVYAMTDGIYMHEWKKDPFVYDVRMNVSDNPYL